MGTGLGIVSGGGENISASTLKQCLVVRILTFTNRCDPVPDKKWGSTEGGSRRETGTQTGVAKRN